MSFNTYCSYGIRYATNAASLVTQLHRWAVRHCLETYGNLLPGFDQVSYDQEAAAEMSEIGESEMLEQVLDRETRVTFQDGQLRTLHLLRQLISQTAQATTEATVSLFGTINFPRVWEVVCQQVFADRGSELSSRLPIPTWHRTEPATTYQNAGNRLIPDLVWFDDHTLLIGDAKYYTVRFGEKGRIVGAPGMPDLTKQLLYEQALTAILQEPGQPLRKVYNVFIMPTARLTSRNELAKDWHWGNVQTNIPTWEGRQVGVWFIPPAILFECYVAGSRLSWR